MIVRILLTEAVIILNLKADTIFRSPRGCFSNSLLSLLGLNCRLKKAANRIKRKKTRTVTLRPHHVRQSPYPCRFLFAYMYYRIPFSKGTNSYFFFFNSLEQIRK